MLRITSVLACVSLAVALTRADGPKSADPKKVAEELQGEWKLVSVVDDGIKEADVERGNKGVKFDGNKYAWLGEETEASTGTFTIDSVMSPKLIDLHFVFQFMGKSNATFEGIWKIEGEQLTLCMYKWPNSGRRPKEFKSEKQSHHLLLEFKKVKK